MTLEEISSRVAGFLDAPDPARFDALAREVFRFQFNENTPYRAFCEAQRVTPATLNSPSDIPAIVTTAFKDFDLSCLPTQSREYVFHSSGTTAHRPSRHFHSPTTMRLYESSVLRWFEPNVLPDGSRATFLILTPRASESPHSSLVHMFETVSREFSDSPAVFCASASVDGSWLLNLDQLLAAHSNLAGSATPLVVCGTAFSFVHLCDLLAERDWKLALPAGSRVFETGGYKGRSRVVAKPELHRLISHFLSVPETHIISEYGMSELSSQAYDRMPGATGERIYQFPPWARASVISPETGEVLNEGETGLLRVLDLANVGSVMAVQTEDIARRRGPGFELLGRATAAEARGCSLMHAHS